MAGKEQEKSQSRTRPKKMVEIREMGGETSREFHPISPMQERLEGEMRPPLFFCTSQGRFRILHLSNPQPDLTSQVPFRSVKAAELRHIPVGATIKVPFLEKILLLYLCFCTHPLVWSGSPGKKSEETPAKPLWLPPKNCTHEHLSRKSDHQNTQNFPNPSLISPKFFSNEAKVVATPGAKKSPW